MQRKPMPQKPRKRLIFWQWKQPSDVGALSVSGKRIGGGWLGDVFIGKVKFVDGSTQRVAVKTFKYPLSDYAAREYQTAIQRLSKAGVPLPKMAMLKYKGEWVQVSQLFAKGGESKLEHGKPTAKSEKLWAAEVFAKTINAGYAPISDFLNVFKSGERAMPIDLDSIIPRTTIDRKLFQALSYISALGEPAGFKRFFATLEPQYKIAARRVFNEYLRQ